MSGRSVHETFSRKRKEQESDFVVCNRKVACGVDVVDMDQFRRDLDLGGERFVRRIYTETEFKSCHARPESLAARFAAKEATVKALGTGIRRMSWLEIEIKSNPNGAPQLMLTGRAAARAKQLGLRDWSVSLSHSKHTALAVVVAIAG